MKTNTFIPYLLFLFPVTLIGQIDCNKFLEQGKKAAKQENFELAMNSFNSARRCGDKAMGELVDKEVTKLFNAINKKKEIAEKAQKEAEALLKKFQAASAEIVDALVREANNRIYHLDYAAATAKLRTAADLDQLTTSFKKALSEVAFFWNEAGQTEQAADLLMAAKETEVPHKQIPLRTWLTEYSGSWHDSLLLRYYPNMVLVKGGEANIDGKKTPVSTFKIANTETTMWQYSIYFSSQRKDMCTAKNFRYLVWGINGDNPVVEISWFDAARYANWLNKQFKLDTTYIFERDSVKEINHTAKGYRLPTEAEWEYAARGGPVQDVFNYAGNNVIDSVCWYDHNSDDRTQPVARKKENSLGLYDMSGNVWEWCSGLDLGPGRNRRGGSYFYPMEYGRIAPRDAIWKDERCHDIGFRLIFQL